MLVPTVFTFAIFVATVSISDVASFKSSATVTTSETASAKSSATATTFTMFVATVLTEAIFVATNPIFVFAVATVLIEAIFVTAVFTFVLLAAKVDNPEIAASVVISALSEVLNQVFSK